MSLLIFLALFAVVFAAPNKFVHPGVLVDANRLKLIRNNLNREPFKSAFQKALDSPIGDKSYKPEGPPSNGIIECGSYSNPDKGCSDEGHDGAAAYLQMILFALTDEPVYAKNAVNILNAYGKKLKAYTNSNAPLQAGWGSGKWARAAELAKHLPGVNWASNDIAAFERMVRNVQIPFLINGATTNGNWELSKLSGLIGYGVFLDDKAIFDKAVQMWIERTPAYIYNVRDGNQPKKAPRGNPDWYGQEEFSARTSGHSQETCRDLRHTMFGISDMINVAETAYIQGVDLFSKEAARISQGLEYNAKLLLGSEKVDKYICGGKIDIMRDPTFEVGYNAYANRLGLRLPYTLEYIKKYTRTDKDPRENHMIVYETLTHGTP